MTQSNTTRHPRSMPSTFAFAGGISGLVAFLAVALKPALVYGGFAGVTLAAGIFGAPVDANLIARGIVLFGMVVGLLATAALFTVIGAAAGAGVYAIAKSLGLSGRRQPARDRV